MISPRAHKCILGLKLCNIWLLLMSEDILGFLHFVYFLNSSVQFSMVARPLFKTYNETVKTDNLEEFNRSVSRWTEKHCSLVALRPGRWQISCGTESLLLWGQCVGKRSRTCSATQSPKLVKKVIECGESSTSIDQPKGQGSWELVHHLKWLTFLC